MPNRQPTLTTARFTLRPFVASDAPELARLLNVEEVARETLNVPYPYPADRALPFIVECGEKWQEQKAVTWAITDTANGALVGGVGLTMVERHKRAEIGYWITRERWGQGIAAEAGKAVVAFGFEALNLDRIEANHYPENPASGAVLRKLGMRHEGHARHAVWRDNVPRDLERYAMISTDPR
jgi:ribosomal-protein-alanine N-acetyltransferase